VCRLGRMAQFRGVAGLERVLIVFDGGRVEAVSE
jgi:hypothetical protein